MAVSMRAVPAVAVVLLASVFVVADDASSPSKSDAGATTAAQKEGKSAAKSDAKAVRLTKPWSALTSLSEDQKRQINQIHRKKVADVKVLEQKEKDEIMALLSDEQKAEVTALLEKQDAAAKEKAAQKKTAKPAAAAVSEKSDSADGAAATEKADADKKAVGSN